MDKAKWKNKPNQNLPCQLHVDSKMEQKLEGKKLKKVFF